MLEPVIVEAKVEATDDEDDDAEVTMDFGELPVGTVSLESKRESDLLPGRWSVRVDKPVGSLDAPELRLFAVPLAVFDPEPVTRDSCNWAI
jgi:hypothetical protein